MRATAPSSPRILIIGAGGDAICMAINLQRAGIEDFIMLEKARGIGGTWWHNQYPGAECDVQSHLYSYSFEPKFDWSRPFAGQAENG
jgi:cation diffusion facilitator CzcD-associated flavoprotein CzcO